MFLLLHPSPPQYIVEFRTIPRCLVLPVGQVTPYTCVTLQPGSSGAHQAARAGRGMSLHLCPSSGQGCTHSSTGFQPPLMVLSFRGKSCYSKSSFHQHICNLHQVVTARCWSGHLLKNWDLSWAPTRLHPCCELQRPFPGSDPC